MSRYILCFGVLLFVFSSCDEEEEEEVVELWGKSYNIDKTTRLDIEDKGLTGEIPTIIGDLVNLEIIHLSENELTGEIPSEIGNLRSLTKLDLSGNQLSGNIPYGIYNLENLEILLLDHNQLSGSISSGICDIPFSFYDPDNCSGFIWCYVQLSYNNFCSSYPTCLPEDSISNQDCP